MTEKQQELVTKNIGLIGLIINKYKFKYDYDELFEVGMIGLCKGVKVFDANKGYKPTAILSSCIRNEILMFLRKNKSLPLSLDNIASQDGKITYEDMIADESINIEQQIIRKMQIEEIKNAMYKLNEKERIILAHVYEIGGAKKLNQAQLSKILNISQSYVCRILNKAILKIRKECYKED